MPQDCNLVWYLEPLLVLWERLLVSLVRNQSVRVELVTVKGGWVQNLPSFQVMKIITERATDACMYSTYLLDTVPRYLLPSKYRGTYIYCRDAL